jgi:hypothetical protein
MVTLSPPDALAELRRAPDLAEAATTTASLVKHAAAWARRCLDRVVP